MSRVLLLLMLATQGQLVRDVGDYGFPVPVEDVLHNPEAFNNRVISMSGYWYDGPHGAFICVKSGKSCVAISLDCENCEPMRKLIRSYVRDGYLVTVGGRIHHSKRRTPLVILVDRFVTVCFKEGK
jgi:hypothetical protein